MATGFSGFPSVTGISPASIRTGILGQIQSGLLDIFTVQQPWGIYKDGQPVIEVDSVIDASVRAAAMVSDYRVMPGSFASYNKVTMPRDFSFKLGISGDQKEAFLKWVETNREGATLFDAVFPEKTYKNVTLIECSSIRDVNQGTVSRIIADCRFREVREAPTKYYKDGEEMADTQNAAEPQDLPMSKNNYVDTVVYQAKKTVESVQNTISNVVSKYDTLKAQFGNGLSNPFTASS